MISGRPVICLFEETLSTVCSMYRKAQSKVTVCQNDVRNNVALVKTK